VPRHRSPARPLAGLRCRPSAYWAVALALALVTALVVTRAVGRAEAHAARLGGLRAVAVATATLPAGATIGPGDAEVRRLPAALVPPGAVEAVPDGSVVAATVHEGEVLLDDRLAPAGTSPLAAGLPPGTRAVAVPVDGAALPVEPGDVVDVLATFDRDLADGAEPTVAVAREAVVADVTEGSVVVAVTPGQAPRVAFAVAAGAVALAVVAPSGDPSPPPG
jgi:Flp pilus assembly protein CpaB